VLFRSVKKARRQDRELRALRFERALKGQIAAEVSVAIGRARVEVLPEVVTKA